MAKYRKKPVEIEAVVFFDTLERLPYLAEFMGQEIEVDYSYGRPTLRIKTLEGVMVASEGDFIIKGIKNEFYPCKPDIFFMTYDEVIEEPTTEETI